MNPGDLGSVWCGVHKDHTIWYAPKLTSVGKYECDRCRQQWATDSHVSQWATTCNLFLARMVVGHPLCNHAFRPGLSSNASECTKCGLECALGSGDPDSYPQPFVPFGGRQLWSPTATSPARTAPPPPTAHPCLPGLSFESVQPKKRLCECGSHVSGAKDYGPGHSQWCPAKER